jgi:histidine triad (HIT) family protein
MPASLSRLLFTLAKSPLGAKIIRWSFAHMTAFMPLDKLRDTELVVAFYHPKPSYKIHILIVPKREIASFTSLQPADFPVLHEIVRVAQELVAELGLLEKGYRLIVNGGAYQDVAQMHYHLISDE